MMKLDPDFGLLVRANLIEKGLEIVHDQSDTYNYTHLERKAVIEKSLKQIYDIVGVKDTPFIKELAKSIYGNYQGLSYRYFPELKKTYDLNGSINSIGDSMISSCEVIDERDWTNRRTVYVRPIKCKSLTRSIPFENIKILLDFFAMRPVSDLDLLKSQIEETLKLLYTDENKFEINLHVFYAD